MAKTCLTYFVATFPQEKKIIIRQLVSARDLTYVKPANGWYEEDSWKEERRREIKKVSIRVVVFYALVPLLLSLTLLLNSDLQRRFPD